VLIDDSNAIPLPNSCWCPNDCLIGYWIPTGTWEWKKQHQSIIVVDGPTLFNVHHEFIWRPILCV
jgi:hypothetical protein